MNEPMWSPAVGALQQRARALGASDNELVVRFRAQLSRLRDAVDHPQLRDARRLLRVTRKDHVDVLLLGESVLSITGPHDADQRRLPTMVAQALGAKCLVLAIHGGGYHAELLGTYLELLAGCPDPPGAVVVPLWVRGRFRPWIEHPQFGHIAAMERLRRLDSATPAWRIHGSLRRGTVADFEAFHRVPHSTLLGELTVGDYVVPLKARKRVDAEQRLRLLYAYHHSARLVPGSPELTAVTRMGSALRASGSAFLAYQTPLSVRTGAAVLGDAFVERVEQNFQVMTEAFRLGAGHDAQVLEIGMSFSPEDFVDPLDGTEHLNDRGRARLAGELVDGLARLAPPQATR